jgi:spermidine/putrescine transport system ATP-binding protein
VPDLHLSHLVKDFGPVRAVDDVDLTIPSGSFFALLGPSGCGKTTTLRMIAGLDEPTSGRVLLGDEDVTRLKPYKRPVNTVFQNYALFPHLNVFDNVAFGPRRQGRKFLKTEVEQMLELVELQGLGSRKPGQLSGGQQQRVALARAIINRPQVLLLDEPLGALDLKLRRQMQIELKRIQTEVGLTFVHVTHDQEEAMTMADTIAVMNAGHVEQLGPPLELYDSPSTVFVANFLGQSNLVRASVTGRNGQDVVVEAHGRKFALRADRNRAQGDEVFIGVRPEKLRISVAGIVEVNDDNSIDGVVTDTSFVGVSTQYLVKTPWDQELTAFSQNVGTEPPLPPGEKVSLRWRPEHTFCLDASDDISSGLVIDDEANDLAVAAGP